MIGYNPQTPGGTDPESNWKRATDRKIQALQPIAGAGMVLQKTNQGVVFSSTAQSVKGGSSPPTKPTPFTLKSVMGDYLVCDGNGELDVKIAKNFKLRNSILVEDIPSIDGIVHAVYVYSSTVVRVATFNDPGGSISITETQVIVPRYIIGDLILAMKVTGSASVDDPDEDPGTKIPWIDMNIDARAWSRSY